MGVYGNTILNEENNTLELIGGKLFQKIYIDKENKTFVIKGINFNKFLSRLKEMYKSRGIVNLFDKQYSIFSMLLYKQKLIHKDKLKITQLDAHLFFALEIYRIFLDLGDFYNLPYYKNLAKNIYQKTWISNADKFENKFTNLDNLSKFKYKLMDYQEEYVRQYTNRKLSYELEGDILVFKQGLGKTLTSLALAECLNKKQIVIVCPNSLRENWANEIKLYYKKYENNLASFEKDIYVHNTNYINSKNPKFIIVNQDSIEKIYKKINTSLDTMIIVDESHNFRNINSERTKKLLKLKEICNCKDNLLMSGTPTKATPDELVPALKMIDPYFTDELADIYIKTFNKSSSIEISRVVKERFNRVMYVRTKEQVLHLPEKNIIETRLRVKDYKKYTLEFVKNRINDEFEIEYSKKLKDIDSLKSRFVSLVWKYSSAQMKDTRRYLLYITTGVDPDKTQKEIHELDQEYFNSFLKNYVYPNITNPEDKKELDFLISKYIYMMQSAMGIAIGRVLPPTKTDCYIDIFNYNIDLIIKMINNCQKKTVIFTPFLKVANTINKILNEKNVGCVKIVGETKNRMAVINQFKQDDLIDVLVATTQTLSTGVTLTEANQMFFFGTPYRNADFEQACDRIHRIGQTTDVNIYLILLDSDDVKNITDRIEDIMSWSRDMSDSLIY